MQGPSSIHLYLFLKALSKTFSWALIAATESLNPLVLEMGFEKEFAKEKLWVREVWSYGATFKKSLCQRAAGGMKVG